MISYHFLPGGPAMIEIEDELTLRVVLSNMPNAQMTLWLPIFTSPRVLDGGETYYNDLDKRMWARYWLHGQCAEKLLSDHGTWLIRKLEVALSAADAYVKVGQYSAPKKSRCHHCMELFRDPDMFRDPDNG